MSRIIFALILACFLAVAAVSQTGIAVNFDVAGVIRDKDDAVVPGLKLQFVRNGQKMESWTDINGEFKVILFHGDYTLTADSIPEDKFRVFLKIRQSGLNPEFINLLIDLPQNYSSGSEYPKIIKSDMPKYPPAARAVRAYGNVVILVKIDSEGQVVSENVITGHPLLRGVSLRALRKWVFERSASSSGREATITFVYLLSDAEKPGVKRYNNPYRPIIIPPPVTIHETHSQASSSPRPTQSYAFQ